MIGVKGNSSGTTSIRYGVTRDKIVEIKAVLSDGSSAIFKEITSAEFIEKKGTRSKVRSTSPFMTELEY
jgi:FAD/FMN-containing dehydrogenase